MIKAGVIGWPIEQSKSPLIHGYWLEKYGINGRYEQIAVPPDALGARLVALFEAGYAGVNITVPHKETVLAHLDEISARARRIGAVNTLTFQDGRMCGDNTDSVGFINNLKAGVLAQGLALPRGSALILGAGGAARAVLDGLIQEGFSQIFIANRTRGRAEVLAKAFQNDSTKITAKISILDWQEVEKNLCHLSLLVNTTSLGMVGQEDLVLDLSGLNPEAQVTDIVYNPLKTKLLQQAEARGNRAIDGLGMLLHQAVPGFERWFGRAPEVTQTLRARIMDAL